MQALRAAALEKPSALSSGAFAQHVPLQRHRFPCGGQHWPTRSSKRLHCLTAAYRGAEPLQAGAPPAAVPLNGALQRAPPRPVVEERYLARSLVVDKQVITRTDGRALGVIAHLYVDPRALAVVSLSLRAKGLGGSAAGNMPLAALCQIGDVVLVHDARAVMGEPLDEGAGCLRLVGATVEAADGRFLGRVRDYSFSPDSGRVDALRYDALGLPAIPEAVLTVLEVGAEAVARCERGRLTLRPGAELAAGRVSEGLLGLAIDKARELLAGGDDGLADGLAGPDGAYDEWRRLYGAEWARWYGLQSAPATRGEMDVLMRRGPQALPAPRQPAFAERVAAGRQRQREPLRDPRTRRATATSDPRTRVPAYEPQAWRQPAPPPAAAAGPSGSASVPILDRRPPPVYRRRDADGRFGERPPPRREPAAAPQTAGVAFDDFVVRAVPERARAAEPMLEAAGPGGPYAIPMAGPAAALGRPRSDAAASRETGWPPAPQLGASRNGGPGGRPRGVSNGGPSPAGPDAGATYRVVPQAAGQARAAALPPAEQSAWPARQAAPGGDARE